MGTLVEDVDAGDLMQAPGHYSAVCATGEHW